MYTAMGLYNLRSKYYHYIKASPHTLKHGHSSYIKARPSGRAEAGWRANAPLKLHIRRRHLLIHIKKLAPEPLHILVRQLLLLIQEIVDGHFPQQHMDTHKYGIHPAF